MAKPADTTPPGELMYSAMSLSGFQTQEQQLRHDQVWILNWADHKNYALFEQSRVDVIGTFAACGLLNHHRNQLGLRIQCAH
jgi:hypothetical protein